MLRAMMANQKPLLMTRKDWEKHRNATDCHICNKSLVKDLFLDSLCMTMIQAGIAAKATEDATTRLSKN